MTMIISQTSYAQDSQVIITGEQLKQTNLLFNRLEMLEQVDSINSLKIESLMEANDILRGNMSSLELGLSICDSQNNELKEENEKLHSDIKRARKAVVGSSIVWVGLFALLLIL